MNSKEYYSVEYRNGYKVSNEMKQIWAKEIELLLELDRVCKKYNLRYFADSGTLLGAVRHKGFIPWDDDIDVVMMRSDYDKLMEVGKSEFKNPFFFQSAYTDKKYIRGHAQLRNSLTCAMLEKEAYTVKFNQGIFIDIFPLDAVPQNDKDRIDQVEKLKRYIREFQCVCRPSKSKIKNLIKDVLYFVYPLKLRYKKFEECAKQYTDKDEIYIDKISFRLKNNYYKLKKEWYDKIIYMPFEDITIPVPFNYDEILKEMYGEYMKQVKAPTCHGNVIFDVNKSYKQVIKEAKGRN